MAEDYASCDDMLQAQRDIAELAFRVSSAERAQGRISEDFAKAIERLSDEIKELRESLSKLVPVWVVPMVGALSIVIGVLLGILTALQNHL